MPRQSTPTATRPAAIAAGTITVNRSAIPARPAPPPGRSSMRTIRPEEELPLKPPTACEAHEAHGRFWPILEVDGRPICPVEAIEAVKAGRAVLADPEATHAAIVVLERNARMISTNTRPEAIDLILGGHELKADENGNLLVVGRPEHWFGPGELSSTYYAVVGADGHRRHVETARRAAEAAGIAPGDDVPPGYVPPLLTPEQVCAILQVSPRTLDRIAGQTIPPPLRIGGQRRWDAVGLARFLSRDLPREAVAS